MSCIKTMPGTIFVFLFIIIIIITSICLDIYDVKHQEVVEADIIWQNDPGEIYSKYSEIIIEYNGKEHTITTFSHSIDLSKDKCIVAIYTDDNNFLYNIKFIEYVG